MHRRDPGVARDLLPAASLSELIGDPFGRWMCSTSEPQKLPPAMTHNQQAIEQPKRDCRHHEQVHRGNPISMVTKERPPSRRGRNPPPHHIFGHAGLADIDAQLEKLAMDPRCSSQRIGAAHLADKLCRISTVTACRPQRCFDFHRQYDLKPARCQRITVSGRTIASASYILGNRRQTPPNISLSIEMNGGLLELARRSTLICCLSTKISASSATRDRSRSMTIPKISLHKSNIEQQHRPILDQPPADWIYDRDRILAVR